MTITFNSLSDETIPEEKIRSEYIPKINKYIIEWYEIKRMMMDPEKRASVLDKFKLIVDLLQIYELPDFIKFVKDLLEEREQIQIKMKNIEIEREKEKEIEQQRHKNYDNAMRKIRERS